MNHRSHKTNMRGRAVARRIAALAFASGAALWTLAALAAPQGLASDTPNPTQAPAELREGAAELPLPGGRLSLQALGSHVLRLHFVPASGATPPTLVMAPPDPPSPSAVSWVASRRGPQLTLRAAGLRVVLDEGAGTLTLFEGSPPGRRLLQVSQLARLAAGTLTLRFEPGAPLYGVSGSNAFDKSSPGLTRSGRQVATAGDQGNGGAPLVWSTAGFGVLADSKGATFDLEAGELQVSGLSRPDPDLYLMAGDPDTIFAAVADLSGHAPLFPKWSLGFMNSQWGIDEQELRETVQTYRDKQIPLDAFVLDFDWKAWGEDEYGEFRWNPQKFPHGPSGQLARELGAAGVHLVGIMKPRLHVDTSEGRYATEHKLWIAGQEPSPDYFSHKPVENLDFDQPQTRAWFFNPALEVSFATGIVGWWNDEADEAGGDTQFLNMQRALYEHQRSLSPARVFSLNRNFWLGAQRYAYALWSGDIPTGFPSMALQRARMLSAISSGEMWWSMDGGGFHGHPSDENYARWIELGAFTPIFRVHGDYQEKRQPWRYGPLAEQAATGAIRLRSQLLPYMYAYAWHDHVAGVGLVRPLAFAWPQDPKVRNADGAWLFGQYLLVSPVAEPSVSTHQVYLPAGTWTDWWSGKVYSRSGGGQWITVAVDNKAWRDIPLFIRQGAIIPTQPVESYAGEHPLTSMQVEVFPDAQRSAFDYYDDDGATYAYEHEAYFLQQLTAQSTGSAVSLSTAAPRGSYRPALKDYVFAVHRMAAAHVSRDATALPRVADLPALRQCADACWTTGHDRYGAVSYVKLPAGTASEVRLQSTARAARVEPTTHP